MIEYEKDAIVHPYITEYIRDSLAGSPDFLRELEQYAAQNAVPIVQQETGKLLSALTYMKRPRRVLEVGCAIGYSALLMAQGLEPEGRVTTLEYNPELAALARENIAKAGYSKSIEVIEADAKEYLPALTEDDTYDIIFLDGPKAHYIYMLDDCVRLLKKGGVLISDNVLYKGMTATNQLVIRRKITIVKRLRRYIAALTQREDLETAVLSVGDGVTLSTKK